ncbi:hypothetical protein CDN99_01165 [Roseateles aquatilis]|uniref:Flagellar hook-length control protein-like C-terminal domain-containing protein n=1 Tax=Roseateles aquatilis TaxID=431061 RepID=A0A246JKS8_9BURK|nr:flagellar hook-length control protein FliK [Roseateles aquatilis]OWQ93140.1 hypothetical protein CDN99_01165 [Roseateles aquatilis]
MTMTTTTSAATAIATASTVRAAVSAIDRTPPRSAAGNDAKTLSTAKPKAMSGIAPDSTSGSTVSDAHADVDAKRAAQSATTDRTTADRTTVVHATAPATASRPFGQLMSAAADERDAGAAASAPASGEGVDILDAALMRALDELLGRAPGGVPPADAAIASVTARDGDSKTDDTTADADQSPAGSVPVPLTSMLTFPLVPLPAAMPRAMAASTRDGSSPSGAAPGTSASSASAMAADPARLLAMQPPGAGDVLFAEASATPVSSRTSPADAASWQNLQRWNADLSAAMTAVAPTDAGDVSTSVAPGGTLTLPASREAWQQPLLQALGDRLQLQIAQRGEGARLHLSPPELGRIEIDIRQQGGALQVQLSASHDEVRQQLRQIAEPLRHELVQRHSGDVSVQVAGGAQSAGDGRGRDGAGQSGAGASGGQARDGQRQPGRALGDDDTGGGAAFAFDDALDANTRNSR